MAILSIDTYLQASIKKYLGRLLSSPYIIREVVLADFEPSVKESFIATFCPNKNGSGKEIPVIFTFPQAKQDKSAFMLIQFKGGSEYEGSLGNNVGNHIEHTGNATKETLRVQKETKDSVTKFYVVPKSPVADVISFEGYSGQYRVADGRVYLEATKTMESAYETISDFQVILYYTPYVDKVDYTYPEQPINTAIGYDLSETYTIDSVSNNMDTLRCLDALLRTILIYMRDTMSEQVEYRLPNVEFMGTDLIQELNDATNSGTGEQLFYRRAEVSYVSTYSINVDKGTDLKDVSLKQLLDTGGK